MAVSVAYGLIFGTFILLIVLPSLFLVVNKLRYWFARYLFRQDVTHESVEPAVKETLVEDVDLSPVYSTS
jgi:hypothetical protein